MASFFEEEYSNLEDKFKKKVEQDKVAAGNDNIVYLPPSPCSQANITIKLIIS